MQTKLFNIPEHLVTMPCKNARLAPGQSAYGISRNIPKLKLKDIHNGIDIHGDRSLMAIADGKVLFLTYDDGTGSKTIVTAHGSILPNGYVLLVLYAHCDGFVGNLKKNDKVFKGQIIANMGMSGNATGVHLHCSMYAIPPEVWHNKTTNKWYEWSYTGREQYQINPSWVLGL